MYGCFERQGGTGKIMGIRETGLEDLVMQMRYSIYERKNVLITGNTGFKGSWLALWLEQLGAQVTGYALAPESLSHFSLLKAGYPFICGDIRDEASIKRTVRAVKPEIIFHLAAQSLVSESYRNPLSTYETNVTGTLNVLEAARSCESVKAIVVVTTDKVYENDETGRVYAEED